MRYVKRLDTWTRSRAQKGLLNTSVRGESSFVCAHPFIGAISTHKSLPTLVVQ